MDNRARPPFQTARGRVAENATQSNSLFPRIFSPTEKFSAMS